jgi:hypothetical protein
MDRRSFLRKLGYGAVATLAVAHVPAAVVKSIGLAEPARHYAYETLRNVYVSHAKAHPGINNAPRRIHVGRELYEAYESELTVCYRFSDASESIPESLKFKGASVIPVGRGWRAEVVS